MTTKISQNLIKESVRLNKAGQETDPKTGAILRDIKREQLEAEKMAQPKPAPQPQSSSMDDKIAQLVEKKIADKIESMVSKKIDDIFSKM
jgi:hypothetical protein